MKTHIGVANTDQVNRHGQRFPAEALAWSIENAFSRAKREGVSAGLPTCISHDLHRLEGWNFPVGLHLSHGVARQVTQFLFPEDRQEWLQMHAAHRGHLECNRRAEALAHESKLRLRAGEISEKALAFGTSGTCALRKTGIARDLYPTFFDSDAEHVDKDGLVSLRYLTTTCRTLSPGIFLDSKRDLAVFAHQFFRRSLSHLNSLNEPFLQELLRLSVECPDLDVKIRLDPDIVGLPSEFSNLELEYWRGPRFTDEISAIKPGVAEHAADASTRFYGGVERTQFWWKSPESRNTDRIRTLEMEEILCPDVPSAGMGEDYFGCRYLHAEYSEEDKAITHFDGAVRGYRGASYEERRITPINRAGKHTDYTKLFRVDGPVGVSEWKSLVCAFFRSNDLIAEYFQEEKAEPAPASVSEPVVTMPTADAIELLVGYGAQRADDRSTSSVKLMGSQVELSGEVLEYIEDMPAHVADVFKAISGYETWATATFRDARTNLPRVVFPRSASDSDYREFLTDLGDAIGHDYHGSLISASFEWHLDDYSVVFSILGKDDAVGRALKDAGALIDLSQPPSNWIENLKALVPADGIVPPKPLQNVCLGGFLRLAHEDGEALFAFPNGHPFQEKFLNQLSEEGIADA